MGLGVALAAVALLIRFGPSSGLNRTATLFGATQRRVRSIASTNSAIAIGDESGEIMTYRDGTADYRFAGSLPVVALGMNGDRLVSLTEDGEFRAHYLSSKTDAVITRIDLGSAAKIVRAALDDDNKRICFLDSNLAVKRFSLAEGNIDERSDLLAQNDALGAVAISGDGSRVAYSGSQTVYVMDGEQRFASITSAEKITSICFLSKNVLLLSTSHSSGKSWRWEIGQRLDEVRIASRKYPQHILSYFVHYDASSGMMTAASLDGFVAQGPVQGFFSQE